jgi:23S rRNA (pseudouridine1915-N3)-methyltransferase
MLKIKIISVNKTKETWLEEAISTYVNRLKTSVQIEFLWAKNDEQFMDWVAKEPLTICLDANGTTMSSEQFSKYLYKQLELGGSRLCFAIGGAEGLPKEAKQHYPLLSLSMMTFPHQMIRLFLVEQIYRAFEIAKGSSYDK